MRLPLLFTVLVRRLATQLMMTLPLIVRLSGTGVDWAARGEVISLTDLPDPGLPIDDPATALQALILSGLVVNEDACRRALHEVQVPGRMQDGSGNGAWMSGIILMQPTMSLGDSHRCLKVVGSGR